MAETMNQQDVALADDIKFSVNFEIPCMDDASSAETHNASGELAIIEESVNNELSHQRSSSSRTSEFSDAEQTEAEESADLDQDLFLALMSMIQNGDDNKTVPRAAGEYTIEIEEFIPGIRRYFKNIISGELREDEEELFRQLFSSWNRFLQLKLGIWGTSAFISLDINEDIYEYLEGAQLTEGDQKGIRQWLLRWNRFLQARADKKLVSRWDFYLTIVGFLFYLLDLGSDFNTCIIYVNNRQWWQAIVTLVLIYGAVIIHTAIKWRNKEIHCADSADCLRYVGSLLINWPDVKQYGRLCLLEWKLCKSLASNTRLVPEWHQRRYNVTYLKFIQGICEACPQAILQLRLLIPSLYGDWTGTDCLRIASATVSLCSAGAVIVNWEKYYRIHNFDLPPRELIVLHVWAVPVTVSRLLSVTMLLTVHPYWCLAGIALHILLHGVYWCSTDGIPRALDNVLAMLLTTLLFFISPFGVTHSLTYHRVCHAVHFIVNTIAMMAWALSTPLICTYPTLYTAIICFNLVMFVLGLSGWLLHEKYWPDSYPLG